MVCFFFQEATESLEKRSLNHLLLPEISKVEDYPFSLSKNTKITLPSTVFSRLIILRDNFIPGLCLNLTHVSYFCKICFCRDEGHISPRFPKTVFHMWKRVLCKLTLVFNSQAKYPPYCLNLHPLP